MATEAPQLKEPKSDTSSPPPPPSPRLFLPHLFPTPFVHLRHQFLCQPHEFRRHDATWDTRQGGREHVRSITTPVAHCSRCVATVSHCSHSKEHMAAEQHRASALWMIVSGEKNAGGACKRRFWCPFPRLLSVTLTIHFDSLILYECMHDASVHRL